MIPQEKAHCIQIGPISANHVVRINTLLHINFPMIISCLSYRFQAEIDSIRQYIRVH